jgi:hypothetical protein
MTTIWKGSDMHRYFFPALGLLLAVLAGPAPAATSAPRGAGPEVLMSDLRAGVVEQVDGSLIKINGKTYLLAASAGVYEQGLRSSAQRLAAGKTVSFTLIDDKRIKDLWINK